MPMKSRRKLAQTKKRKQGRTPVVPASAAPPEMMAPAVAPPVAEIPRQVASPRPSPRPGPAAQTLAGRRYPYVGSELRNIGILTAIVVAILVILGFVLPR